MTSNEIREAYQNTGGANVMQELMAELVAQLAVMNEREEKRSHLETYMAAKKLKGDSL